MKVKSIVRTSMETSCINNLMKLLYDLINTDYYMSMIGEENVYQFGERIIVIEYEYGAVRVVENIIDMFMFSVEASEIILDIARERSKLNDQEVSWFLTPTRITHTHNKAIVATQCVPLHNNTFLLHGE